MYIRFLKLNPHCAFFILLQALYNSHSKKNMPTVPFSFLTLFSPLLHRQPTAQMPTQTPLAPTASRARQVAKRSASDRTTRRAVAPRPTHPTRPTRWIARVSSAPCPRCRAARGVLWRRPLAIPSVTRESPLAPQQQRQQQRQQQQPCCPVQVHQTVVRPGVAAISCRILCAIWHRLSKFSRALTKSIPSLLTIR
jgi:hypothetical protein